VKVEKARKFVGAFVIACLATLFSLEAPACQVTCVELATSAKRAVLTDFEGHPLANAKVVIRDASAKAEGPKAYCGRLGPIVMKLQADSKGVVDISKLKPGEYWLTYMDDKDGESFYLSIDPSVKSNKSLELSLNHLNGSCYVVDVERNVTKPSSGSNPVEHN